MPRKFMFTKDEIIFAALNIVRKNGMSALTARALGNELGSSSKPVFSIFDNMSEVQNAVLDAANREYQGYIEEFMKNGKYPPYKASGMAYISFAREEKELFKLLFMRDRTNEVITENREEIKPLIELIMQNTGSDEERAYIFHLEMWVYVHGIAAMAATSYLKLDEELISRILTDAYKGLEAALKGEI